MVNTDKLKGIIVSQGLTQKYVYEKAGLTARQWQVRMESKKFDSTDIENICNIIGTEHLYVFFDALKVTQ